jgi:hypothetical protein
MSVQAYNYVATDKSKKKPKSPGRKKGRLSGEDIVILTTLEKLKRDLDIIYSSLDSVTDPTLIDSFIYDLSAVNMRYKFYLQQCKEKGIVGKFSRGQGSR